MQLRCRSLDCLNSSAHQLSCSPVCMPSGDKTGLYSSSLGQYSLWVALWTIHPSEPTLINCCSSSALRLVSMQLLYFWTECPVSKISKVIVEYNTLTCLQFPPFDSFRRVVFCHSRTGRIGSLYPSSCSVRYVSGGYPQCRLRFSSLTLFYWFSIIVPATHQGGSTMYVNTIDSGSLFLMLF